MKHMILPFKIKGNLTISGYYGSKKILWIQSVLGPKSDILSPKCAYGGSHWFRTKSPKNYHFLHPSIISIWQKIIWFRKKSYENI